MSKLNKDSLKFNNKKSTPAPKESTAKKEKVHYYIDPELADMVRRCKHWDRHPSWSSVVEKALTEYFKDKNYDPIE